MAVRDRLNDQAVERNLRFIRRNADIKARRLEAADLVQGLDPVFATGSELQSELLAA